MHFGTKSYLKSTSNHTAKHADRKEVMVLGEENNFEFDS